MDIRLLRFCFFTLGIIGLAFDAYADMTIPDTYISISELYKYCQRGECGRVMPCEGKIVKVVGHIDRSNILTRSQNPRLLEDKFLMRDNSGVTLEVLVIAPDPAPSFKKISDAQEQGKETIFVKAIIVGVDLPLMGSCHRCIRLELHHADDISFE